MKPVVIFPDPRLATRNLLRSLLANRPETYAKGVTVSTRVPPTRSDDSTGLPYVQVSVDGRFRDYRLNGTASVRVVVWHRDVGLAEALASLCEGLLLAAHGNGVRNYGPLSGPLTPEGGDPETGTPMTAFTLTARLQPETVRSS